MTDLAAVDILIQPDPKRLTVTVVDDEIATHAADDAHLPVGGFDAMAAARFEVVSLLARRWTSASAATVRYRSG